MIHQSERDTTVGEIQDSLPVQFKVSSNDDFYGGLAEVLPFGMVSISYSLKIIRRSHIPHKNPTPSSGDPTASAIRFFSAKGRERNDIGGIVVGSRSHPKVSYAC